MTEKIKANATKQKTIEELEKITQTVLKFIESKVNTNAEKTYVINALKLIDTATATITIYEMMKREGEKDGKDDKD